MGGVVRAGRRPLAPRACAHADNPRDSSPWLPTTAALTPRSLRTGTICSPRVNALMSEAASWKGGRAWEGCREEGAAGARHAPHAPAPLLTVEAVAAEEDERVLGCKAAHGVREASGAAHRLDRALLDVVHIVKLRTDGRGQAQARVCMPEPGGQQSPPAAPPPLPAHVNDRQRLAAGSRGKHAHAAPRVPAAPAARRGRTQLRDGRHHHHAERGAECARPPEPRTCAAGSRPRPPPPTRRSPAPPAAGTPQPARRTSHALLVEPQCKCLAGHRAPTHLRGWSAGARRPLQPLHHSQCAPGAKMLELAQGRQLGRLQ